MHPKLVEWKGWLSKHRWQLVTAVVTLIISTYLLYLHLWYKCDVRPILLPLLATATRHFSSVQAGAGFFLDYGSLLGAWRDGGMIPHEFDIDMAVMEEDCDKYVALRPQLEKEGLHMYTRGEYVPMKANWLLGYSGYLSKACLRLYDWNKEYYIDFDWYKRMTYEEAIAEREKEEREGRQFILPKGYKKEDGDVLCNIEAWDATWPGGCRLVSWVYPLQPFAVYGVPEWIPADPVRNLEEMYGPDWKIPKPKGYKMFICPWLPIESNKFIIVWMLLTLLPYAIYRVGPILWTKLLILTGRRNVTYQYSTLPLTQK